MHVKTQCHQQQWMMPYCCLCVEWFFGHLPQQQMDAIGSTHTFEQEAQNEQKETNCHTFIKYVDPV
jgi:hypothetical protein